MAKRARTTEESIDQGLGAQRAALAEASVALARASASFGGGGGYATGGQTSYRTAEITRLRSVTPRGGSADSHLTASTLRELRRLSQDAMRNNALACALVNRACSMDVGNGLRLSATSGDDAWNREAEAAWKRWWHSTACDATGMRSGPEIELALELARIIDGDVLVLKTQSDRGRSLQIIEAERIGGSKATPRGMPHGVELDAAGRPVRFNLSEYDPAKGGQVSAVLRGVDAEDCIYYPTLTRPGQVRGEPRLASALDMLALIDRMMRAIVGNVEMSAAIHLITQTASPAAAARALPGTDDEDANGTAVRRSAIEDGGGYQLHVGKDESVTPFDAKQPLPTIPDFLRMNVRMLGNLLGLPIELALMDISQANYASAKMVLSLAQRQMAAARNARKVRVMTPIYEWFIRGAMASGELRMIDDWNRHRWQDPANISSDPGNEAQSDQLRLANRTVTHRELIEQQGGDFEETMEQIARERAYMDTLGVLPMATPGAVPDRLNGGNAPQDGAV